MPAPICVQCVTMPGYAPTTPCGSGSTAELSAVAVARSTRAVPAHDLSVLGQHQHLLMLLGHRYQAQHHAHWIRCGTATVALNRMNPEPVFGIRCVPGTSGDRRRGEGWVEIPAAAAATRPCGADARRSRGRY